MYNKEFYDQIDLGAMSSAIVVVPMVIQEFGLPDSVIDFGCGTGAWLHEFSIRGVKEIYGVDGSNDGHRFLTEDQFELFDLGEPYVPLHKYDLAITLEVAEHLPEEHANAFVANVARCSDNILWSAAVPGQRGLNHINEQWPSYWVPKFQELGFYCNGCFRYEIWDDPQVETWYKQNILLFSRNRADWSDTVRDIIHPNNYGNYGVVEERFKL